MRPFSILLLGLLLAACDKAQEGAADGSPPGGATRAPTGRLDRSHAGTPAPRSIFEDPAGEAITLADFRGRPLLVNLWATWCAPCIAEMPTLDALAAREKGLQVLAVSEDMNGHDKVDAFFAERNFRAIDAYLDPQMQFMMERKLETLPTTILYDADGKEVWRMVGRADWESERVARLLDEAEGG